MLLVATVRLAGDGPLSRRDLRWTALAGLAFFAPSLALAALAGPELPSLAGALIGGLLFVIVARRAWPGDPGDRNGLVGDLAPYLAIVALILLTRLVAPLQGVLSGWTLDWSLHDRFAGSFAPAYHPGTLLWLGLLAAAAVTGRAGTLLPAASEAVRRLAPVALALGLMLALSRLMVQAGLVQALAGAATATGPAWPMLAPWVGVLGTFITGSATASNILFTELQLAAADGLALPPLAMAAAQNLGAAIGNVLAPHNIIAGAATVGLVGREGDVLRRTLVWGVAATLAGGVLTLGLVML